MQVGRVVGTLVATRKDERLVGTKLLVVRIMDPAFKEEQGYAVDQCLTGFEGELSDLRAALSAAK